MPNPSGISLGEHEEIEYYRHPSKIPYLSGAAGSFVLVCIGALTLLVELGVISVSIPVDALPLDIIGSASVAIGIAGIMFQLASWRKHEYIVTNQAIYDRRGIISQSVDSVTLDRVEKVEADENIMTKLFSYGSVKIKTTGGTDTDGGDYEIDFDKALKPLYLKSVINDLSVEKKQSLYGGRHPGEADQPQFDGSRQNQGSPVDSQSPPIRHDSNGVQNGGQRPHTSHPQGSQQQGSSQTRSPQDSSSPQVDSNVQESYDSENETEEDDRASWP